MKNESVKLKSLLAALCIVPVTYGFYLNLSPFEIYSDIPEEMWRSFEIFFEIKTS